MEARFGVGIVVLCIDTFKDTKTGGIEALAALSFLFVSAEAPGVAKLLPRSTNERFFLLQ